MQNRSFHILHILFICLALVVATACDGQNPLGNSSASSPNASPTPVPIPTVISKGPDVQLSVPPTAIITPSPIATATAIPEPTPVATGLTPSIEATPSTAALAITTLNLSTGTVGTAYSHILQGNGGTGSYTWTVDSGQIPPGLSLSSAGDISGTPTQAGNFNFVVKLVDQAAFSAVQSLQLSIFDDNNLNLSIASTFLDPGEIGFFYDKTLKASGGSPPYSWTLQSGALPPGLSLLNGTGQVKGGPTKSGAFTFTIKVTDTKGQVATRDFSGSNALTINQAGASVTITTQSLPLGRKDKVYGTCPCNTNCIGSTIMAATGGTNSFSNWSVISGSLPPGVSLSSSGTLSGTPTQIGTYTFTIQSVDSAGNAGTKQFSIKVAAMTLSSFTPTSGGHGVTMTVKGDNFSSTLNDNTVTIGGKAATSLLIDTSVVDCHSLDVQIPIGVTTGLVNVSIPDPANPATKTITGSSADLFTVNENEVVINEVFLKEAADPNNTQFIELRNYSNRGTIDISGWTVNYTGKTGVTQQYTIPNGVTIPQGGIITIKVRFGDPLTNTATTLFTGLGLEALRLGDGQLTEIALCSTAACTADNIRDYAEFGTAGGGLEGVASDARIWTAGAFIKRASTDVQATNTDTGTNLGIHVVDNSGFAIGDVVEVNSQIRTVLSTPKTNNGTEPRLLLDSAVTPAPAAVKISYPKSLHYRGSGSETKDYFFGGATEGSTSLP